MSAVTLSYSYRCRVCTSRSFTFYFSAIKGSGWRKLAPPFKWNESMRNMLENCSSLSSFTTKVLSERKPHKSQNFSKLIGAWIVALRWRRVIKRKSFFESFHVILKVLWTRVSFFFWQSLSRDLSRLDKHLASQIYSNRIWALVEPIKVSKLHTNEIRIRQSDRKCRKAPFEKAESGQCRVIGLEKAFKGVFISSLFPRKSLHR